MSSDLKSLKFAVTALIDGELNDTTERSLLESEISSSGELQIELHIQKKMKEIVSQKCVKKSCPLSLKNKILQDIRSGKTAPTVTRLPLQMIYAISAAAVFIIAFLIIRSNEYNRNLLAEQSGENNMVVQAANNFGSILAGKLTPQIVTSNKEKITAFFRENGVSYGTVIPNVSGCTLLGGVVSDDKGEKLAHHIYADSDGKLIYVFQADEAHFTDSKLLAVSDELWGEIKSKKVYFSKKGDYSLAIFKNGSNISTVVSNQDLPQLQQELASYNL